MSGPPAQSGARHGSVDRHSARRVEARCCWRSRIPYGCQPALQSRDHARPRNHRRYRARSSPAMKGGPAPASPSGLTAPIMYQANRHECVRPPALAQDSAPRRDHAAHDNRGEMNTTAPGRGTPPHDKWTWTRLHGPGRRRRAPSCYGPGRCRPSPRSERREPGRGTASVECMARDAHVVPDDTGVPVWARVPASCALERGPAQAGAADRCVLTLRP